MTKKNYSDNILIDNLIYQAQSNIILCPGFIGKYTTRYGYIIIQVIIHISNYIIFYVLPSFIHLLFGNSGFGKPHMNVKQKFKSVGIICRRYMFTMRAEFNYLAQLHNPSCNDWGGGGVLDSLSVDIFIFTLRKSNCLMFIIKQVKTQKLVL